MRSLISNPNVDNSDPTNYPNARIKDNSGIGDGTAVNERTKGDLHQMVERLMILYGITANNLPDNVTNGYQIIDALIALASKNDYILDLTTAGGILQIPVKVALMKTGESLICLSSANLTSETTIKGSDNSVTAVAFSGNFKANEYVRFIKTPSGVTLVRIGDNASLNAMVGELSYLKKASQAQENSGSSDLAATTPLVNKVTFTKRVIGDDSATYLANSGHNGLMSKEQYDQLASLTNKTKNVGWFSGYDVASPGTVLPRGGDITSANSVFQSTGRSLVEVNLNHPMSSEDYYVVVCVQGFNSDTRIDSATTHSYRIITDSKIQISFTELNSVNQNLKVTIEVKEY